MNIETSTLDELQARMKDCHTLIDKAYISIEQNRKLISTLYNEIQRRYNEEYKTESYVGNYYKIKKIYNNINNKKPVDFYIKVEEASYDQVSGKIELIGKMFHYCDETGNLVINQSTWIHIDLENEESVITKITRDEYIRQYNEASNRLLTNI